MTTTLHKQHRGTLTDKAGVSFYRLLCGAVGIIERGVQFVF